MSAERPLTGEWPELLDLAKRAAGSAAVVHRSAIEAGGFKVYAKASSSDLVTEIDREAERQLVINALAKSKGNKSLAAQMLGISRKSLYKKLIDYGISTD